jgi:hypothetical protein
MLPAGEWAVKRIFTAETLSAPRKSLGGVVGLWLYAEVLSLEAKG